jgi:hypothetical protein
VAGTWIAWRLEFLIKQTLSHYSAFLEEAPREISRFRSLSTFHRYCEPCQSLIEQAVAMATSARFGRGCYACRAKKAKVGSSLPEAFSISA